MLTACEKSTIAQRFIATFKLLEYNRDSTLYGTVLSQFLFTLSASGDQFASTEIAMETLKNGQVKHYGPFQIHGVRLILTPPAP
jgi:hypothetical protein